MKGLILINAYADIKEQNYGAERLREELTALGAEAEVRRNDFFAVRVEDGVKTDLSRYDFLVYFDKDKYVLQGLEKSGVRLFNGFYGVEACDDKMTTYLTLAGEGIRIPKTLSGVFCFERGAQAPAALLDRVERELSYPLVMKECYGSRGTGVYLIHDRSELKSKTDELICVPHLYQQFIASSFGRDLRVLVIGGRAFGGMLRESEGDFRSNVSLGGRGTEYPLTEEIRRLSEKIASLLRLDYCGIDFLFDEGGKPAILCEVNSNAFFAGFEKVTGRNVARAFAEHIVKSCGEGR